ncbi:uncharacterized protein LOC119687876 [Teleopsis dalmanni]|uniref:uncharacterized protein LOC119687876 n=1 Tax=Teleopsis dalmanni TaxID=139649 RepID=UPI0018CE4BBD|nr:uncharacterized protein LOC119687876 [Teleopsis dalmanni]
MFKPFKNFISYIQKNATSTTIFGAQCNIANNSEAEQQSLTLPSNCRESQDSPKRKATDILKKMEPTKKMKLEDYSVATVIDKDIMKSNFDYGDVDIETQLKTTIIPLKIPTKSSKNAFCGDNDEKEIIVSENLNEPEGINGKEYINLQNKEINGSTEDFYSVSSIELNCDEDTAEEIVIEDEDVEENFVDLSQDEDTYTADREIIVITDVEMNSSLASEAPSEDPLALEDFASACSKKTFSTSIDESTIDEGSANEDIIWLDVSSEKSKESITLHFDKDLCDTTPNSTLSSSSIETPQRTAPKSAHSQESNLISSQTTAVVDTTDELPSDNSDSGLGNETIRCTIDANSLAAASSTTPKSPLQKSTKQNENFVNTSPNHSITPLRSALRSSLKRRFIDNSTESGVVDEKKEKRSINFDSVQVFYFPRQQGFGCVPSTGGCTLGMGAQHVSFKTLTLAEHAAEIRRAHRLQLQEINPRGSSEDETEESEEDYLSEGSGSDLDGETNGFLQPVSPRQRRSILKAAGVRKIDASEKKECRDIRNSRDNCGCTCRDFCDPETCSCNQAGIKCQVDRLMFPCGCSRDACGNTIGRVEFNPSRVRTHFIHTIMRLEMEQRPQQSPNNGLGYGLQSVGAHVLNSPPHQLATNFYLSNMHSQSNYSSGYASPAYNNNEHTANYYQSQQDHQQLPPTHYNSVSSTHFGLEGLDSNLFNGTTSSTPAYGEIIPAYGNMSTAPSHTPYYTINYPNVNTGIQNQVSEYSPYHLPSSTSYLPQATFSSCAVPSEPPYGSATTTATTTQYHSGSPISLDTTASTSCTAIEASETNFINLSAPIASSSRLSQINDLLQHNRNTTAALVAVTESATASASASASTNCLASHTVVLSHTVTVVNDSIDTPPIENMPKPYTVFEELKPAIIVSDISKQCNDEIELETVCIDSDSSVEVVDVDKSTELNCNSPVDIIVDNLDAVIEIKSDDFDAADVDNIDKGNDKNDIEEIIEIKTDGNFVESQNIEKLDYTENAGDNEELVEKKIISDFVENVEANETKNEIQNSEPEQHIETVTITKAILIIETVEDTDNSKSLDNSMELTEALTTRKEIIDEINENTNDTKIRLIKNETNDVDVVEKIDCINASNASCEVVDKEEELKHSVCIDVENSPEVVESVEVKLNICAETEKVNCIEDKVNKSVVPEVHEETACSGQLTQKIQSSVEAENIDNISGKPVKCD